MEKKRTHLVDHNRVFTNVMVWPALIILLLTSLLPIIYVLVTSLTDMTLITMNRGGTVGWTEKLHECNQDKDFLHSIG